ncbi:hypothetical protein VTJ49DRAFT_3475 [Mycothermus thermophilus]|uniref:Uncharacterized protein n=1 Tax=Humicola insolens TaxID=85995 RepID=A0ABR3VMR7_HUMIN
MLYVFNKHRVVLPGQSDMESLRIATMLACPGNRYSFAMSGRSRWTSTFSSVLFSCFRLFLIDVMALACGLHAQVVWFACLFMLVLICRCSISCWTESRTGWTTAGFRAGFWRRARILLALRPARQRERGQLKSRHLDGHGSVLMSQGWTNDSVGCWTFHVIVSSSVNLLKVSDRMAINLSFRHSSCQNCCSWFAWC